MTSPIFDASLLRFDHFMQAALYDPQHGFYASGQTRTGTQGDFLTPVSAGPVLGQLLARLADELHAALHRPPSLLLVEQGADRGLLTADLLTAISSEFPELRQAAQVHVIEPSPALADRQKGHLQDHQKSFSIEWHPGVDSFVPGNFPCFFFSCELVDSFPVRLARFEKGDWCELWVGKKNGHRVWVSQPAPPDLRTELQRWNAPPLDGYTAEIRPSADSWIRNVGHKIRQGLVLTMDYGMSAEDLYHPTRSAGTLVALRQHRRQTDPLQDPGKQDLTSHVNYTELIQEGEKENLRSLGLIDFSRAWTRVAEPLLREGNHFSEKWIRNFHHLTHPGFFGKTHQILVQGKSLPATFTPSMLLKL